MSDNTIFVALEEFPEEIIRRLHLEPNCYLTKTAYPKDYPVPGSIDVTINWRYYSNAVETFYEYKKAKDAKSFPVTACPNHQELSASSF